MTSISSITCILVCSIPTLLLAEPDLKASQAFALATDGKMSSGFLHLTNTGDEADFLNGARTSAASEVELHAFSASADGVVEMTPISEIQIAPGFPTILEPGGYHLMLIGLTEPLVAGNEITVTLEFATSDDIEISMPIIDYGMITMQPTAAMPE